MLKPSAERCAAAEAGHPRDAGAVQLGINLLGIATRLLKLLELGRELGQQRSPHLRPVRVLHSRRGFAQRRRQRPPPAASVAGTRRRDLAAEG